MIGCQVFAPEWLDEIRIGQAIREKQTDDHGLLQIHVTVQVNDLLWTGRRWRPWPLSLVDHCFLR